MGFSFDETMAGTMTRVDRDEPPSPIAFSVHAHAASTLRHLRDGKARLTGLVEAPGLAAAAPCEGELTLRPVVRRIVRYELTFRGDDGRTYHLAGEKHIRWLDAVRTWTTLPAEITDDAGRLVARCDLRFDLAADWMTFASSWRAA